MKKLLIILVIGLLMPLFAQASIWDAIKNWWNPASQEITLGATILFPSGGGTGKNTSNWTGYPYITAGAWGTSTPSEGGSTTTINGVSGPTFTFSTSTAGFTISTSTGIVTFGFAESDPLWVASSSNYYLGSYINTNYLATGTIGVSVQGYNANNATTGSTMIGLWNGTAIGTQYGGTNKDTSGWTGYPYITAGTWGTSTPLSLYARSSTKTVCATNTIDRTNCDYVCDGTADEVQIQAANNALGTTGGKVLLLEGTYNIATNITISSDVTLSGTNPTKTILNFGSASVGVVTNNNFDIFIQDIYFKNSNKSTGALRIGSNGGVTVKNCYFSGNNYDIYSEADNYPVMISNNVFTSSNGVRISTGKFVSIVQNRFQNAFCDIWGTHHTIVGNTMWYSGAYVPGINCSYSTIVGNTIGSSDAPSYVYVTGSKNTISNNTVYSINTNAVGGIYVIGDDNVVDGNIISGNTLGQGIRLDIDANYNTIANNRIRDCNTGILINDAASDKNLIHGNYLLNNTTPITDNGTGTISFDNVVTNNALFNLSGLTTDKTFTFPDASGTLALAGTLTNTKWCTSDGTVITCTQDAPAGGGVTSLNTFTGALTLWGTSPLTVNASGTAGLVFAYTESDPKWTASSTNFANWNTAYDDRLKWDGGATGLVAATGRTSLGLGDSAVLASSTWTTPSFVSTNYVSTTTGLTYLTSALAATTYLPISASSSFAWRANNLSDLAATSTARTNLGLGTGDSPTFVGITLSGLKNGLMTLNGTGVVSTTTVGIANMASVDFGGFTCNGSTCGVDSDAAWTGHNSYPSACTGGQAVIGLADTLTCSTDNATTGTAWTTTNISGLDISDDTNLAAGRSLTLSGDSVELDAEIYGKDISISIYNASDTMDAIVQKSFSYPITITEVECSTNASASSTIQFDERAYATPNTGGTDVLTAALVCGATSASSSAFANATIAANGPLSLDIDTITGTVSALRIHIFYQIDD